MVIPSSRGMNQSITRMNNNEDQSPRNQMMNIMIFFIEVHLLAGNLLLIVAIHSLGGSRANQHHTPNPQQGATRPTQDEDHTSHEQSTRVPFGAPPGKGQEPLTITMIGARDCDKTTQFIQDQVRLSPLNTLTRAYSHLYKLGSPPSVTQDLGKSTSQPRSRD